MRSILLQCTNFKWCSFIFRFKKLDSFEQLLRQMQNVHILSRSSNSYYATTNPVSNVLPQHVYSFSVSSINAHFSPLPPTATHAYENILNLLRCNSISSLATLRRRNYRLKLSFTNYSMLNRLHWNVPERLAHLSATLPMLQQYQYQLSGFNSEPCRCLKAVWTSLNSRRWLTSA